MILAAALILANAATPPPVPVRVERQATATVRIVPGARLRFAELERLSPERLSNAWVRAPDGSLQPARLIEFQ